MTPAERATAVASIRQEAAVVDAVARWLTASGSPKHAADLELVRRDLVDLARRIEEGASDPPGNL